MYSLNLTMSMKLCSNHITEMLEYVKEDKEIFVDCLMIIMTKLKDSLIFTNVEINAIYLMNAKVFSLNGIIVNAICGKHKFKVTAI